MDKKIINSDSAPEPVGPYPHARKVGNLLFLSGVGPRKKGSKEIPGVTLDENKKILSYNIEAVSYTHLDVYKRQLLSGAKTHTRCIDMKELLPSWASFEE